MIAAGLLLILVPSADERHAGSISEARSFTGIEKDDDWDAMLASIRKKNRMRKIAGTIFCVLALVPILIGMCIVTIPTGYTGVRSTFGQIEEKVLPNGMNFRTPFVQSIEKVNNKQQDVTLKNEIWGETREKVQVYMSDIVITYQIDPQASSWIVANVADYKQSLISAALVSSAMKNSVATLPAEKATVRSEVEPLAQVNLQKLLDEKYGENVVYIHKIAIGDMNFEDSYNTAVSERNMAELTQQKQAIENQTAIEKAEADKKVKLTEAEAKAQVLLTEAEAEKEANLLKEASLTDKIITSQLIQKWNGVLPMVTGNQDLMLDIGKLVETSASM